MEFHFHVEGGFGHEAFEFCHTHFLHIHELHVACDHRHDGGDRVVRVAQAAQDVFGHVGTKCVMAVEADAAAIRIDAAARGLCDVVQQHGEAQLEWRIGCEHFEHDHGVDEDIAFRVPFRWLIAADQSNHLRHEVADQIRFDEVFDAFSPAWCANDF